MDIKDDYSHKNNELTSHLNNKKKIRKEYTQYFTRLSMFILNSLSFPFLFLNYISSFHVCMSRVTHKLKMHPFCNQAEYK